MQKLWASYCKVCEKACRYFPLNQVLKFTDKGFRGDDGICVGSKSQYFHDICLGSSMVEVLVQLNLLGRGSQYEIASDEGNPLYVVEYTQHDIRAVEITEVDVTDAIMQSFVVDSRLGAIWQSSPDSDVFRTPVWSNGGNLAKVARGTTSV